MKTTRSVPQMLASARDYLEYKAGSAKRPDGKFLLRQETRLGAKTHRYFKRQEDYFVDGAKSMTIFKEEKGLRGYEAKEIGEEIDDLLAGMPYQEDMVEAIVATARTTYKKGAQKGIDELEMGRFGITFDLINQEAVQYLANIRQIQLSNYRGNISRQTKDKIRKILVESAETGRSYQETARLIREQGTAGVFSRARGELIAVNQVGHAYGEGNMEIVNTFKERTGQIVEKYWQTVNDGKVTDECQANQDMGWIGYDDAFLSGDENAPRDDNPRCRCATIFRTVDAQGNPT
jgi:hypothetical protein